MSKLVSPWRDAESGAAWDRIRIGGVLFEGKVDVDGTPWKKKRDKRHSRGHNGARSVGAGYDLGEWTITLMAFDDATDAQLGELVDVVTGGSPATQDLHALSIDHPALAVAGVSQVTFEEGDVPEPDPTGKLVWTFKVKEHRPPPPQPVVRTPAPAPQRPEPRPSFTYQGGVYVPHVVQWEPGDPYVPVTPATPSADP
jgi:hypothetical protein